MLPVRRHILSFSYFSEKSPPMLRRLLAVILGIVGGVVLIGLLQYVLFMISPPPEGMDLTDPKVMADYIASLEAWKLLLVIVTYAIGAAVGGFLGSRMTDAQPDLVGMVIGLGLTVFALLNLLQIPHPVWFWILALLVHVPCALWGSKQGQ